MENKVENEYQRTQAQKTAITDVVQSVVDPTWMIIVSWHGMDRDIETAVLRNANMSVADLRDWIFSQCPTGTYVSSRHYQISDIETGFFVVESLFSDLPENTPLYKDSGLWQLRSDDMEEVLIQQGLNESDADFLLRCKET